MDEVDLVVVGHLGSSEERTPSGVLTHAGGSAYLFARGATVVAPGRLGIVASVGQDYDIGPLEQMMADLDGLNVLPGKSAQFVTVQHVDGHRTFTAEMGAAMTVETSTLPVSYHLAAHVHLASAPPRQQREWLDYFRAKPRRPGISVDMFEKYTIERPTECRQLCDLADLVFINEAEASNIGIDALAHPVPVVLKKGAQGAAYFASGRQLMIAAEPVSAVDTTGAGEVLAGVFLRLRLLGIGHEVALRYGVRAATASVKAFGVDDVHLAKVLSIIRSDLRKTLPQGRDHTIGQADQG